ncbi:KamA family radical SAM protein [Thermovibrio ammonificans]|jgi:lysine 2,3-aminomutase
MRVITSLEALEGLLPLSPQERKAFRAVVPVYPFSTTEYYARLAAESFAVRRMLLPSLEELNPELQNLGEPDPLREERDRKAPRLTHRYPDRVLVVTTNYCPVLCRFCMRKRNWRKPPFTISEDEVDAVLSYVRRNPQVRDVLISGGEPLLLPLELLERLLLGLKKIESVEVVRIGTRLPVVEPSAVLRSELLSLLERAQKVWVNTHFNHPDELTAEAAEAVKALLKCGVPVNNQTVLLKGVNDSVSVLERLFRGLQRIKVRPYYLFHCDPVEGVMHFSTPISLGLKLLEELQTRLSPLALPYYAVDGPGGYGKVPMLPVRFEKLGSVYRFRSFSGRYFTMPDR